MHDRVVPLLALLTSSLAVAVLPAQEGERNVAPAAPRQVPAVHYERVQDGRGATWRLEPRVTIRAQPFVVEAVAVDHARVRTDRSDNEVRDVRVAAGSDKGAVLPNPPAPFLRPIRVEAIPPVAARPGQAVVLGGLEFRRVREHSEHLLVADGPLVQGRYAEALDAIDEGLSRLRQAASADEARASGDAVAAALLAARAATWQTDDGAPPEARAGAAQVLAKLRRSRRIVVRAAHPALPRISGDLEDLETRAASLRSATDFADVRPMLDEASKKLMALQRTLAESPRRRE